MYTLSPPVVRRLVHGLVVILGATALGACNYVADRSLDFLDQFRLAVGIQTGGGVRVSSLGLVETGLTFGIKPHGSTLGWRYGRPFVFLPDANVLRFDADQSSIIKTASLVDCDYAHGAYRMGRTSLALLPAVFSWVDSAPEGNIEWYAPEEGVDLHGEEWLWSSWSLANTRYAVIHAFDTEFEIAILGYFETGYSPGEAVDFLLGIFGIDIAQDDGRL